MCHEDGVIVGAKMNDGIVVPLVAFANDECAYSDGDARNTQRVLDLFADALKWTISTQRQVPKCVSFGFGMSSNGTFGPMDPKLTINGLLIQWVGNDLECDSMFKYVGMWVQHDLRFDHLYKRVSTWLHQAYSRLCESGLPGPTCGWRAQVAVTPVLKWSFLVRDWSKTDVATLQAVQTAQLRKWFRLNRSVDSGSYTERLVD